MSISNALGVNDVATATGINSIFQRGETTTAAILPMRVAVIGNATAGASFSTNRTQYTTASSVGAAYGYGSPLHLSALSLFPTLGTGIGSVPVTFYPLADEGGHTSATITITPSGTQSSISEDEISLNGLKLFIVVPLSATVADRTALITAAVNGSLSSPVVAVDNTTTVTLTAKWTGSSSNDIKSIITPGISATAYASTAATGGAGVPDLDIALNQFSSTRETIVVNCLGTGESTILDALQTFNESRWDALGAGTPGALVRRPFFALSGDTQETVALATTVSETRKSEYTNVQETIPESESLPLSIASRTALRVAIKADALPSYAFIGDKLDLLDYPAESFHWAYADRNEALLKGVSTVLYDNDELVMGDLVTFYHPDGDDEPQFRYVTTLIKLWNCMYNFDLGLAGFIGRPLIPDGQYTNVQDVVTPGIIRSQVRSIVQALGNSAIISDTAAAIKTVQVEIDPTNNNRVNIIVFITIAGNVRAIALTIQYTF